MGRTFIAALLIFSILGISCHWKSWNAHQEDVISNIKNNSSLESYNGDKIIYVSGNQYSKYGPLSHIEFMSEGWVPASIFNNLFNKRIAADTINKRHGYENGYMVDAKYGTKKETGGYIFVYDSRKDELLKLESSGINAYIESLGANKRHWIQLISANKHIKNLIAYFAPHTQYIFQ